MNILTYENISSAGGGKNIEIHLYCILLYATSNADNPISRLWRVIQDSPKLSSILLYTDP